MGLITTMGAGLAMLVSGHGDTEPLPPRDWTPLYVQMTLRTWSGERGDRNAENGIIDIWSEPPLNPSGRQIVWYARRETQGQVEIISTKTCPALRRSLEAFEALPPSHIRFNFEISDEPTPLEPIRKDGADYRLSYRTGSEQVRLRFLSHHHYQWASRLQSNLNDCWSGGWRPDRNEIKPFGPMARPD